MLKFGHDFSNNNTLKILFDAYDRSMLDYAFVIWNPYYQVLMKLLSLKLDRVYPTIGSAYQYLLKRCGGFILNMH